MQGWVVMGDEHDQASTTLHAATGEAAFMAVEALILALIDNRVLTAEQMIETTELCAKTKRELAKDGIDSQVALTAARLLGSLANSLQGARPRLPFAPGQPDEVDPGVVAGR